MDFINWSLQSVPIYRLELAINMLIMWAFTYREWTRK